MLNGFAEMNNTDALYPFKLEQHFDLLNKDSYDLNKINEYIIRSSPVYLQPGHSDHPYNKLDCYLGCMI